MLNTVDIASGGSPAPGCAVAPAKNGDNHPQTSSLFRRLQRSVNSALHCLLPQNVNTQLAWMQAVQSGLTAAQDSAAFIIELRQRLQHPDALALLAEPPASVIDIGRWLPVPVQPLLNDQQTRNLMALALKLPPQKMNDVRHQTPALYQLLVDEVNKLAARQQSPRLHLLLPQLLRLPVISQALLRMHPLLPLSLWAVQLLWQIQRQGLINAADDELRHLLHQHLMMIDASNPDLASLPRTLSEQQLWRQLNQWVDQRLSLLAGASAPSDHGTVSAVPPGAPLVVREFSGWWLNSALNQAAATDAALLVKIHSCYELLQRQTQAIDIAVGCFADNANRSHSAAEWQGMQLLRSLVIDDNDNLYAHWQLESGAEPLVLQGVTIPAQARPLMLRQLAGPYDRITLLTAGESPADASAETLARALVTWTQQQLTASSAGEIPLQEVRGVSNPPAAVTWFSKLVASAMEYGQHLFPVAAGGRVWPFAAVSAEQSPLLPPVADNRTDAVLRCSVEDFIDSLWFKYPDQLAKYPEVIVTQTRNRAPRDSEDRQMPLAQALIMMEETENNHPELLLNFHPGWHKNLADDIHDFLRGKVLPRYNASAPVNWNSTENQQAAWQIGVGVGRKSVENMVGVIHEINCSVLSVERWMTDTFRALVTEYGGNADEIRLDTPVSIFVTMPASYGRQHIPIDRGLDGTRQHVYKQGRNPYTLRDIFTDEYKRGAIRAESLTVEFPAGINPSLQQAILSINLQSRYINELDAEMSKPTVKTGMLNLFQVILNNTLIRLEKDYQIKNIPADVSVLRTAIKQGEIYLLNWFGYTLHNLIFIQTENGKNKKGIILSLWDRELVYFKVNIDLLSAISLDEGKKAAALLALLDKSLPIVGRVEAYNKVGIYDKQIIINTSERYEIAWHGKAILKKTWQPADEKKSLLSLIKPLSAENEMLKHFIAALKQDMGYLVLTDKEHDIDTAIEVLDTICILWNLFAISAALTSASGGTGLAAKVLAGVSSWKANVGLTLAFNIFPRLIKSQIADRPEERKKAWIEAMLNLAGEGVSFLLNQHGGRVLRGVIHQGGRAITIPWRQLPGSFTNKVSEYAKRYFLSYRAVILRAIDFTENQAAIGESYELPYIEVKAPAPLNEVSDAVGDFSRFIKSQFSDISEVRTVFSSRNKVLSWLQQMFEEKGARCEIGAVISWRDFKHSQPEVYYVLRVNSPAPDLSSSFSETENVLIDPYLQDGKVNHLIGAEEAWMSDMPSQPRFTNKAIAVKWFDNMLQAQSWSQSLLYGRTGSIRMFSRQMLARPDWYLKDIASEVLKNLERRQSSVLREIYDRESEISLEEVKIYGNHNVNPQLSYLYTSTSILTMDMLAEKFAYLTRNNISTEAVPLPSDESILIATELRGISADKQGNITLTNYADPGELLVSHQVPIYSATNITAAARQAVYSCLYTLAGDKVQPRKKRQLFNPVYVQKLNRMKANSAWLQYDAQNIRVPLLLVIDRSRLNSEDSAAQNHIAATVPADAIQRVLTLDDHNQNISDILAPLALNVMPLAVREKAQWCKTRDIAWRYAMLPEMENPRLELSANEYQPWLAIIDLQATGELIDFAAAQHLREHTSTDNYHAFLGADSVRVQNRTQLGQIQPGARLAFCDCSAGPGEPPLSHALMMLEEGKAIGAHNQLLGGGSGWEIIWLQASNWTNDPQHGLVMTVDGYQYSLHVQLSPESAGDSAVTKPALNKEAIKVIAMAEQYIAQPAAMMGVTSAWEEVLALYRQAGLINRASFDRLRKTVTERHFQPFLGAGAQLARSRDEMLRAPPGSRLIFLESAPPAEGGRQMVHAMVVTAWGQAVGVNNQPVGGKAGWEKIDLAALKVNADSRHGLVIETRSRRLQCIIAAALTDALVTTTFTQD